VRELPSGTVTFLFSDIEGSTRLLHEHGERYSELLSEHRAVLRDAFERHGGVEVDTQGDAFFVAFARASDALAAAAGAQAGLRGGPISVRIGIHTGEPVLTSEGYVGLDVHRAARIAAAGHGGQVLLSQSARDLAGVQDVRDLGEHRLKDLSAPERVFQLGDGRFPPLKSLRQTNLPVPATPFLGRTRELEEVVALLRDDQVQLLTLTGPGGTGKTRLALQAAAEVAEDAPDGVWWVALAPLRDPALTLEAVARALDVRERTGAALEETLADALSAKRALLVIDNAEHLLPRVADDIAWLRRTGRLKLLVTTRERLQLQGEHAWTVPSLDGHDGPALFTARARALRPDFSATAAIAELCSRLDNLPLALELAAARVPLFSPEELLERLGDGLDLKGGRDADPRQQTLEATIRWSYDLLSPDEQRLFARLAVFVGGCTYEAAEAVCDAEIDVLQSLVDKSLLRTRDVAGRTRLWMLETIREFAARRLEASDDLDALRLRHARFFTELVERANPHLRYGSDQREWSARLEADYDNVRAAVAFSLDEAPELALRLVGGISFFLWLRGGYAEGLAWVDAALARAEGQPPVLVGRVHECGAVIAQRLGDAETAARHADAAYAAFASIGDEHGMADAIRERGKAASDAGDVAHATALYTELAELAELIGDRWNGAVALNNLGSNAAESGDWERVVELCGRSAELRRELGNEWGMALALCNVASAELELGRLSSASANVRVAIETSVSVDAIGVAVVCFEVAAWIAAELGNVHEGARLVGVSAGLWEGLGSAPIRDRHEELRLARLRESLGMEAFSAAVEEGRRLTLEEAVARALAATAA
jgi:predicted ATPase/class 3 adenylate cyclase